MKDIAIVIVNWNGLEHTLACLESVTRQEIAHDAIIVVDNGSTDGSVHGIRARFPGISILSLPENRGFTGGVRAGIEAAESKLVILLNNDAIVVDGWLGAFRSAIEKADSDVIAVSGRIVDFAGQKIDFIGGTMTFDGHAFQNHFRRKVGSIPEPEDGSELLFACGGNMIVRRDAFLAAGGFDDTYFAYLEDVDFGWRAWTLGHRILYAREAVVRHRSSATSDLLGSFERGVLFEKNALVTVLKNYDDEALRSSAGAIFLTLLHRLHRYVLDRNGDTSGLATPPLSSSKRGLFRSLFTRRKPHAILTDDLTRMQFRAMEAIFRELESITERRARVQRERVRSDREIFERFPLAIVPTYPGDETLFASTLFQALRPAMRHETKTLDELMQR